MTRIRTYHPNTYHQLEERIHSWRKFQNLYSSAAENERRSTRPTPVFILFPPPPLEKIHGDALIHSTIKLMQICRLLIHYSRGIVIEERSIVIVEYHRFSKKPLLTKRERKREEGWEEREKERERGSVETRKRAELLFYDVPSTVSNRVSDWNVIMQWWHSRRGSPWKRRQNYRGGLSSCWLSL